MIGPAPGTPCGYRTCWHDVAHALSIPGPFPAGAQGNYSAYASYLYAKVRGWVHNDANPPAGALVWYGSFSGSGHVAISQGNGTVNSPGADSTNWRAWAIEPLNFHPEYLGWTDGFNGHHTVTGTAAPAAAPKAPSKPAPAPAYTTTPSSSSSPHTGATTAAQNAANEIASVNPLDPTTWFNGIPGITYEAAVWGSIILLAAGLIVLGGAATVEKA